MRALKKTPTDPAYNIANINQVIVSGRHIAYCDGLSGVGWNFDCAAEGNGGALFESCLSRKLVDEVGARDTLAIDGNLDLVREEGVDSAGEVVLAGCLEDGSDMLLSPISQRWENDIGGHC